MEDRSFDPAPDKPTRERPPEGFKNRYKGLSRFLQNLEREDPEAYRKLMQLKETQPEAFRAELHKELMKRKKLPGDARNERAGRDRPGARERQQFKELIGEYRQIENPEAKAEIRRKLHEAMQQHVERFEQDRLKRLERLEKEITRIREQLEQSRLHRGEMIERKIDELLRDPPARKP